MRILTGNIVAFHLYEVSDTIDLKLLQASWGENTTVSRLVSRRPSPEYLQFANPPLVRELGEVIVPLGGKDVSFTLKAKAFDFGVISLSLSLKAPPSLDEMLELSVLLSGSSSLEAISRRLLEGIRPQFAPALIKPHHTNLMEDYLVFYVQRFDEPIQAEQLLEEQRVILAQILRGEKKPLSRAEQSEALREVISYYQDDLAIVNWNTSFIYDREGSSEHIDVLEFANSELLELRYYDGLMDREMDRIYDTAQVIPHWWEFWRGGHFMLASQKLMALTVDVIELRDQIENAIKLTGDLYSARIYRSISRRLSLREWEDSLDEKLKMAHQIYGMLIDQVNTSRATIMELIVIILIALEIPIFFISSH
jgi:hypothetical protein